MKAVVDKYHKMLSFTFDAFAVRGSRNLLDIGDVCDNKRLARYAPKVADSGGSADTQ
jgi:hypothetical protein